MKGCTPIIHPTTKPPPILSSPASGVATSWPEKERFGAVMELVEEAIFVPLAGEERVGGGFVVG